MRKNPSIKGKILALHFGLSALLCAGYSITGYAKATIKEPKLSSKSLYKGDGRLSLINVNLKENLDIQFRKSPRGTFKPAALNQICTLLRCRLTQQSKKMPKNLIDLIDHIQDHFGADKVYVVSGYRSPELNESLRKTNHRVAKNSYHMKGKAMDIRLPDVSAKDLSIYARSLQAGGVGYYASSKFVHVDVGPVRYWSEEGKKSKKHKKYKHRWMAKNKKKMRPVGLLSETPQ